MDKRFAAVIRTSDPAELPAWCGGQSSRSWALLVVCDAADSHRFEGLADVIVPAVSGASRWATLSTLLSRAPAIWQGFDYLWFADTGIDIDPARIDDFFELVAQLDLELAQPAMTWDSVGVPLWTLHNPSFRIRYSNMIDLAAPCFSRRFLKRVLAQIGGTQPSALEFALPRLLADKPRACAIIDAIQVRCGRPLAQSEPRQVSAAIAQAQTGGADPPAHPALEHDTPLCYGAVASDGASLSLFDDTAADLIGRIGSGVPGQPERIRSIVVAHESARQNFALAREAHTAGSVAGRANGKRHAPIIEVICVAYRRYGPLKAFVQCWLNQTASNWRLKVYHDGPDAEFDRIMAEFAKESAERIAFFHSAQRFNDYGHSLREQALKDAAGDYTLLTNDDNYYVPRLLEFLNEAIASSQADVVMFDMVHSHERPGCRPLPAYSSFQTSYRRGSIDIGAAVVKTELARAAGFRDKTHDGDATYFEDVARVRRGTLNVCKIARTLFVHN